ncbi:hypothetical protein DMUE_4367 [Dictyocoela muelleri]|nr:hypothetical protein DMUE_4367 [Dictyocoela muelleri]
MQKYMHTMDISAFSIIKKPLSRPCHIESQYETSKKWIIMSENDVKKLIFSDESKFNLQNSDCVISIWRKPGEGLKMTNIKGPLKFNGGSVMVWVVSHTMVLERLYLLMLKWMQLIIAICYQVHCSNLSVKWVLVIILLFKTMIQNQKQACK